MTPMTRASLRLAGYLTAAWLLLLVIGFVTLRSHEALAAGNPVGRDRAAFISANVAALAGFSLDFARPDDFAGRVRFVLLIQTLAGALLSLVGGGVLWARLLGRPHSDARLTATALAMIALAVIIASLAAPRDPVTTAAVRGLTAIGCGGVLFGDTPRPQSPAFKLVLVPLSVVGSLGVVVVNDVLDRLRRRPVSIGHAARVLAVTAGVYLVGVAWIGGVFRQDQTPWSAALVRADAVTWAAHAWGLSADFASYWPAGVMTAVVAVAIVGVGTAGSAASMGLAWLWTTPRRLQPMIVNGLIVQALIASAALAALAWLDPTLPTARRLLIVISAVMNLGLSHEPLSITGPALLVVAAAIVAAKLLPLAVFAVALAGKGKR